MRTPSRFEDDFGPTTFTTVPGPGPLTTALEARGDRDYDSENLLAYELGYRFQPTDSLYIDIASFYNKYDNLFTGEVRPDLSRLDFSDPTTPLLVVPVHSENNKEGETYGLEISVQWQALPWWKLHGTYSYLQIKSDIAKNNLDLGPNTNLDSSSPHNQFTLRSLIDIPGNVELDTFWRYADKLGPGVDIDDYFELDLRIGWKPLENLELSIGGSNLLDNSHPEFPNNTGPIIIEVERSVFAKITLEF